MAAWEAYDPLADDPVLECNLPGMPRVQTIAGSRPFEIMRRGEDIVIHTENYNQMRLIDMEPYVDPGTIEPSRLGYSRGHWEGNTLVVETSRIDYPFFDLPPWWGIPQTEALELVERFTLEDDTLVYDFWAYDPTTFAAPIDKPRFLVWTYEPGLEVGIACFELGIGFLQFYVGSRQLALEGVQSQVRFDPRYDLLELERLCDIVHTAKRERLDLVLGLVQRADKDDGNIARAWVFSRPRIHTPRSCGICETSESSLISIA